MRSWPCYELTACHCGKAHCEVGALRRTQVVQEVHVKNRCAWLNHSSDPRAFIRVAEAHPHVRLWFSGHFHLSHNYPDSITVVGGCAFVQTGVIGDCNRDGHRQSRLLRGTSTSVDRLTRRDTGHQIAYTA